MNIRGLAGDDEAAVCARLMSGTDPWITLGRGYEASLRIIKDPSREVYVATDESGIAGFLILCMVGAFIGYIQTVVVAPDGRGKRSGWQRVGVGEHEIFRRSADERDCVSSV